VSQATAAPLQPPLTARAWLGMAAGLIGSFMALVNSQTTAFAVADIKGGVHAGFDGGAWITTAYSMGEIAIIPVTAVLSAVFTTRIWLIANAAAFLVFCLGCAAATSLEPLLLLRLFQGLSGGALIPLSFKIALTTFTGRHKPLGLALFAVTATFSPTITATTDGWITDRFGWSGIFYQNLLPTLLCIAAAWVGLPRDRPDFGFLRRIDWMGAFLCVIAMVCAVVVFDQGNRLNWFASGFISKLALLSVAFFVLFVWHEVSTPTPLVNLRVLLWPQFGLPLLANAFFRVGLLAASLVIPGYLIAIQDQRPLDVGSALLWVGLPQLLLAPVVLALSRRFDERILMTAGLVVFAWGCAADWGLDSQWQADQFFWGQVLQGIAEPFVQVPIVVIATSMVGPKEAVTANILFNAWRALSTTIGAGLIGTLITKREQFHSARLTEAFGSLSAAFQERVGDLGGVVAAAGADGPARTLATIANQVRFEATTMAYADALFVIGILLVVAIAAVWCIPPPPASSGLRTWHGVCARAVVLSGP
jgi:MFS transporter, DHA2 family, multidrug resistance protein